MCAVSMIGDIYADRWRRFWPNGDPMSPFEPVAPPQASTKVIWDIPAPVLPPDHSEEIRELRKEVEDLKELLAAAKRYDEETGQPDCEMEEKLAILRKVAEALGVELPV